MSAVLRREQPVPLPRIDIVRMKRRHLRRVLAIESRVYPRPWSMSLFLSEIAQKTSRSYLVIRIDGEVAGYAGMMYMTFEGHVTNIAVDPDQHGRKLGTRLLLTLITEAIARGVEVISLEVRVTNNVAQDMYAKFGFHVVGVRKGYYIETREDALVMEVSRASSTEYRERLAAIRAELDVIDGRGS